MSVSENNDDDDLDIYSNLPNFHYDDSLQKLESKNKQLTKMISELEKKIVSLSCELSVCKREKDQLEKNISSLYKSAKQEIVRKDKRISELMLREISSSTGKRFPAKQDTYTSYQPNTSKSDKNLSTEDKKESKEKIKQDKPEIVYNFPHRYGTRSRTKKETVIDVKDSSSKSKLKECSPKNRKSSVISSEDKTVNPGKKKAALSMPQSMPLENVRKESDNIGTYQNDASDSVLESSECDTSPLVDESSAVENVQRTPILPEFHGPRTTFSIRRYKKLYGVSPLKQPPLKSSSFTSQSSAKNIFTDKNILTDSRKTSDVIKREFNENITSNKTKVITFLPKKSSDISQLKNFSTNNCDTVDVEKTRLIDNLELLRKVSDNMNTLEKSVDGTLNNLKDNGMNKSVNCNKDKKLDMVCNVNLSPVDSRDHISSVFPEKGKTITNVNNVNDIVIIEDKYRPVDITNNVINQIISDDEKSKRVCPGNIEVVYVETCINKVPGLETDASIHDESYNCNRLPLTANPSDLLVIEEETEVITESHENMLDVVSKNHSPNTETHSKESQKDLYDKSQSTVNKENGKPVIHNKCENYMKNFQNEIFKNKPKEETDDKDRNNRTSNLKEQSNIKHYNGIKLKSDVICDEGNPDSCDSYTLEMTNSPPAHEEINSEDKESEPNGKTVNPNNKDLDKRQDGGISSNSVMNKNVKSSSQFLQSPSAVKTDNLNTVCAEIDNELLDVNNIISSNNESDEQYKIKQQQLKELFGDSPSKSCDNVFNTNENVSGSNFNIFNRISPINKEKKLNDSNSGKDILSLPNVLTSEHIGLADINEQKNENVLITPDISKSYSNFQEAFQHGKLDIKSSIMPDSKLKSVQSPNKESFSKTGSLIDKENPSNLSAHKSPNLPLPNIKHVLCDKKQNDYNISSSNEKLCDLNQKSNEDDIKLNKNNTRLTENKFSSLLGSEIKAKKSLNDPDGNSFKLNENTFFTSGDDSTLCAIKKYSKVGDTISPIKTPFKDFGSCNINTKTDTNISRFSENSLCTENSTFNMIKHYSLINSLVTPIKTPSKQPEILIADDIEGRPTEFKTLEKEDACAQTPTVIKKDGISICLSSEHCEFKRQKRIKKIIKFNTGIKSTDISKVDENVKAKEQSNSLVSENLTPKRNLEECVTNETEFPTRKKRTIVSVQSVPSTKIILKQDKINMKNTTVGDHRTSKASLISSQTSKLNEKSVSEKSKINSSKSTVEARRKATRRESSVCRIRRNRSIDRVVAKKERIIKKSDVGKKQLNLVSKYRYDIKNSSTTKPRYSGVCERRSPSEYFNQQQKSRLQIGRNYNRRSSTRRLSKLKSPTPVRSYRKRKLIERKPSVEMRSTLRKVKVENKKVEYVKISSRTHQLNNSEDEQKRHDFTFKSISKSPIKSICTPVKRLSESPSVRNEIPSTSVAATSSAVKDFMKWEIIPIDLPEASPDIVKRFIIDNKMPPFVMKSSTDTSNIKTHIGKTDAISNVNQTQSSISKTIIIRKRIKRSGERKLEDSDVLTSNVSSSSVIETNRNQENQNFKQASENERNVSSGNTKEQSFKKKPTVQKTRCIVKTPLDFKNKLSDSGVNEELLPSSSTSEESQLSDESWRPKKSFKKRKLR